MQKTHNENSQNTGQKPLTRLFKYHGSNYITNLDFSKFAIYPDESIPASVKNAHVFKSRADMNLFLKRNNVTSVTTLKVADNTVIIGATGTPRRKVPENALYGKFPNGTPFFIEDLRIYGKGSNKHYNACIQVVENICYQSQDWERAQDTGERYTYIERKHPERPVKSTYVNRAGEHVKYTNYSPMKKVKVDPHPQTFNYQTYHWEYIKIPIQSTLGNIITWYVTQEELPEVIKIKDTSSNRLNRVQFPDKRPAGRENRVPDGTRTGTQCANVPKDNTVKKYYLVKVIRNGQECWIRQNNCQLRDKDIPAEIAAGNIKEL